MILWEIKSTIRKLDTSIRLDRIGADVVKIIRILNEKRGFCEDSLWMLSNIKKAVESSGIGFAAFFMSYITSFL